MVAMISIALSSHTLCFTKNTATQLDHPLHLQERGRNQCFGGFTATTKITTAANVQYVGYVRRTILYAVL